MTDTDELLVEVKSLLLTIRYMASWNEYDRAELRRLVANLTVLVERLES
jgi:hypothetical protein